MTPVCAMLDADQPQELVDLVERLTGLTDREAKKRGSTCCVPEECFYTGGRGGRREREGTHPFAEARRVGHPSGPGDRPRITLRRSVCLSSGRDVLRTSWRI